MVLYTCGWEVPCGWGGSVLYHQCPVLYTALLLSSSEYGAEWLTAEVRRILYSIDRKVCDERFEPVSR